MSIRQLALSFALSTTLFGGVYCPPASARAVVDVSVRLPVHAPPPLRTERIGVARPGHVWIGGHWRWRSGRYVWTGGYWAPVRVGYRHVPGHWVACGRHWCYRDGRWVR
ncbi:MAG: YXWGXW repeat-containing protein [Rudaea sp.]